MKKKFFAVMTAAVMSMAVLAGCGDVTEADVQNAVDAVAEQVPDEVKDGVAEAADELGVSANDVADAANEALDAAEDVAADAVEENLTYMGGLYISEEDNDLTLVLVRDQNEGNIVAIVSKLDTFTYGIIETEDKTTDDGVEYTAFTLEGNEYGYYFNEDYTTGGILVDSDGTVYEAKFVDESVAEDYIAQAH